MSLIDWLSNGWLVEHRTSENEIKQYFALAQRDLSSSDAEGLDPDWQLKIAYNAALSMDFAALAASGYRVTRENTHYRAIASLVNTIGAEQDLVNKLDAFRKKRNISQYELAGFVSEKEVQEMKELACEVREKVESWIRNNHSGLMPGE